MSPQHEVLSNYLHVRSDLELYSRSLDLKSNDQVMVEIVTKKKPAQLIKTQDDAFTPEHLRKS